MKYIEKFYGEKHQPQFMIDGIYKQQEENYNFKFLN